MTLDRRNFLKHAGVVSLAGLGATLARVADVHAADYKALVVVFLSGGHDGNNLLVPMDGAYNDYAKARPSLALPKDSLVPLQGTHIGHKFGLSGASRDLRTLFEQQKLAIVANVGMYAYPLVSGMTKDNADSLMINRHPYGHNTPESINGTVIEGRVIPGVGDPNAPESMSVFIIDLKGDSVQSVIRTGLPVGHMIEDAEVIGGASPNSIAIHAPYAYVTNATNDNVAVID
jgi:hypothetical protein